MKPYLVRRNFYYDGEIEKTRSTTLLLEKPFHKIYEGESFDGLCDLIKEHGTIIPFEIIKRKNGKRFLWHYDKIFGWITPKNIKPWKLTITCAETTLTMKELMWFNSEDVIQYLKERGITTCPIIK